MDDSAATVYVVDDDEDVRKAIAWLLSSVKLESKCFDSAAAFLDHYKPLRTGCLVLDVRMPGMSGLELQEHLKRMGDSLPIIFLTAHGDVPMATQAMARGAFQFIEKPCNNQILLDTVQRALDASREAFDQTQKCMAVKARIDNLTDREREVLRMILKGDTNKAISKAMNISPRTVEVHRAHVMEKMNAQTVADLVRKVVEVGINP